MHNTIMEERCMAEAGDVDMELDSDRGLNTYLIDVEIVIVTGRVRLVHLFEYELVSHSYGKTS